MAGIVKQPSRELRRLALRIEAGIDRFASVRGNAALMSQWEAPRHAWTFSNLAMRNAEATAHLARTDVTYAPPAWATARAAVEAAAQFMWLLEPEAKWEREARWLAFMYEGARLGSRKELVDLGYVKERSGLVEGFADQIVLKLPAGYVVPPMPGVQKVLESQPHIAAFYVLASQFVHAAELATSTFRLGLGTEATYGDHAGEQAWWQPLWNGWQAFRLTAWTLIVPERGEPLPDELALVDRQIEEARDRFLEAIDPGPDPRLRGTADRGEAGRGKEEGPATPGRGPSGGSG